VRVRRDGLLGVSQETDRLTKGCRAACPFAPAPLGAAPPGFSVRNLLEFLQPRSAIAVLQSVPAFLSAKASVGAPLLRRRSLTAMLPHFLKEAGKGAFLPFPLSLRDPAFGFPEPPNRLRNIDAPPPKA
jgi:hypothetical protein